MNAKKLIGFMLFLFLGVGAMALEKPNYSVVRKTADFELRQYQPYLVAATLVRADFEEAGNEGFRRLFRYIAGNNQAGGKIAMTAPVGLQPGEKITNTARLNQRPENGEWLVTFMMPTRYTLDTLPQPSDPRVSLQEVPGRLMAALRYSGRWTQARYERQEQRLQNALRDAGIAITGEPELARYDPPFMPWPFRRNEVLIPVAAAAVGG